MSLSFQQSDNDTAVAHEFKPFEESKPVKVPANFIKNSRQLDGVFRIIEDHKELGHVRFCGLKAQASFMLPSC